MRTSPVPVRNIPNLECRSRLAPLVEAHRPTRTSLIPIEIADTYLGNGLVPSVIRYRSRPRAGFLSPTTSIPVEPAPATELCNTLLPPNTRHRRMRTSPVPVRSIPNLECRSRPVQLIEAHRLMRTSPIPVRSIPNPECRSGPLQLIEAQRPTRTSPAPVESVADT